MKFIRICSRLLLFVLLSFAAVSCNTGEGSGGTGSIEGTVYMVLHPDDNYNLDTDTVLAAKEDVSSFTAPNSSMVMTRRPTTPAFTGSTICAPARTPSMPIRRWRTANDRRWRKPLR